MPRSGPTTLSLPPFAGATRRLILLNLAVFFAAAVLNLVLPRGLYSVLFSHLPLLPIEVAHGFLWQLVTYAFLPLGILGTLFAMLTLWFTGSILEGANGSRWLYELFFSSVIGGAVLATIIAFLHLFGLRPTSVAGLGPYAGIYGLLIAIAVNFGDLEFLLFFFVRIKAKYMVAIYILIDVATLLKSSAAFEALLHLSGALCGFLFLKLVPRRGLTFAFGERYFAMRNEFYRNKRRRAARKFEVYMRKQNREVHFDKDGRYVDPDQRDPNDKSWMN